jgi:hypothetical protein
MRSTLSTFTKQTIGRVRRRTSTKQRSITLGGAQFAPQVRGESEERQQLRQVSFQTPHQAAVVSPPTRPKMAERGFGPDPALR